MRWCLLAVLFLAGCPPKHAYPDGRGLEGQLEREIQALRQRNAILERQGGGDCTSDTPPDKLYHELVQILQGGEATISRQGQDTIVTMPTAYLFSKNSFELRDEARPTLDLLATALSLHANHRIRIEGHTDDSSIPSALRRKAPTAAELTFHQALAVNNKLVTGFGIAADRIAVAGHGPHEAVEDNETEAGQRSNRRIEVVISPPVRDN